MVVEAGGIAGNLDRTIGEVIESARSAGGAPRRQAPLLSSRKVVELAKAHGVAERPVLRDRVVRYHVHSEVYRLNGQRVRDLAKAKVRSALDGSALKLDLAQLCHESRDLTYELLGADAMLTDGSAADGGRVVRTGLTAFMPSLGGGTNEIQRNIIADRVLRLPKGV